MSDEGTPVPAQWADDPTGRHRYRFWDGAQWTGHVADHDRPPSTFPSARPQPDQPAAQPLEWAESTAAAATATHTSPANERRWPRRRSREPDHDQADDWADDEDGAPVVFDRRSFLLGALAGGAVVAVIAILASVVLGGGSDSKAAPPPTTRASTSTTVTTIAPTTTVATTPPRPPSQVTVAVLNASGVSGAATTTANTLKALGYKISGAGNATSQAGTVVECATGFESEAAALAASVGGGATIAALPTPPPTGAGTANCVVILGTATSSSTTTTT